MRQEGMLILPQCCLTPCFLSKFYKTLRRRGSNEETSSPMELLRFPQHTPAYLQNKYVLEIEIDPHLSEHDTAASRLD